MGDCFEEKVAQDSVEACAEDRSEVVSAEDCAEDLSEGLSEEASLKTVRKFCPRKSVRRLLGSSVQEHGIAFSFLFYIFDICGLMKHKML